jgi:magnesium-transporting ATPase (P-type)
LLEDDGKRFWINIFRLFFNLQITKVLNTNFIPSNTVHTVFLLKNSSFYWNMLLIYVVYLIIINPNKSLKKLKKFSENETLFPWLIDWLITDFPLFKPLRNSSLDHQINCLKYQQYKNNYCFV